MTFRVAATFETDTNQVFEAFCDNDNEGCWDSHTLEVFKVFKDSKNKLKRIRQKQFDEELAFHALDCELASHRYEMQA